MSRKINPKNAEIVGEQCDGLSRPHAAIRGNRMKQANDGFVAWPYKVIVETARVFAD
jgi:hypothetical protein